MDGIDEPNIMGRGLAVGAAIIVCTLIHACGLALG
jgi:hypothetical protein